MLKNKIKLFLYRLIMWNWKKLPVVDEVWTFEGYENVEEWHLKIIDVNEEEITYSSTHLKEHKSSTSVMTFLYGYVKLKDRE